MTCCIDFVIFKIIMIKCKAAVLIHLYGCAYDMLPALEHPKVYFMEANNCFINNLAAIPDYKTKLEESLEHIIKYIDPKVFHNIHLLHNYTDLDTIRKVAESDLSASFVFVGSIPDVYRPVLMVRTVRVATRFEDVGNIFQGLIDGLINFFSTYLLKEYISSSLKSAEEHQNNNVVNDLKSMNRYTDRLFKSSKDLLKVIQTATGPINLPSSLFTRKTSVSEKESEVKKLVQDGIFAVIFKVDVLDIIWSRIIQLKIAHEELTGELSAYHYELSNRKVGLSSNQFKNARILAMIYDSRVQYLIDWSPLVKNYHSQMFVCRMAIDLYYTDESQKHRSMSALYKLIQNKRISGWDQKSQDESSISTSKATIETHQLTSVQCNIGTAIATAVISKDSSIIVDSFNQEGPVLSVNLESHVKFSHTFVLEVKCGFNSLSWPVNIEIETKNEDHFDLIDLRIYQRASRQLIHIKSNTSLSTIEYSIFNKLTTVQTGRKQIEWLIHVQDLAPISYIILVAESGTSYKWSNEYLKNFEILKSI
jgi:hypothetical protein